MIRFLLAGLVAIAAAGLLACGQSSAPPPVAAPKRRAARREQLARLVEQYWDESQRLNPHSAAGRRRAIRPGRGLRHLARNFWPIRWRLERRYSRGAAGGAAGAPGRRIAADLRHIQARAGAGRRELHLPVRAHAGESVSVRAARVRARPAPGVGAYAILSAKDYENWRARADEYVRWTAQAIANMREGLRRGYVSAARARGTDVADARGARRGYARQRRSIVRSRAIPPTLRPEERRRISEGSPRASRRRSCRRTVRLHDFLRDEYLPRARQSIALVGVALGAGLVRLSRAARDRFAADAGRHSRDRHRGGRAAARPVAKSARRGGIRGQCASILRGCAAASRRLLTRAPEELLDFYAQLKVSAAAAVATEFADSPQGDFLIRAAEPFRAGGAPAVVLRARREPQRAPGAVRRYPHASRSFRAPRTSCARRCRVITCSSPFSRSAPACRDSAVYGGDPGFVEGWGLYAESLGEELGLYRDTEAKFAGLEDQLACAAGLVVDTGVHGLGWTREQALDYCVRRCRSSEAAANATVDRIIALPAEALDCGMGVRTFKGLRAHAEQVLGARFDLRDFHCGLIDDGAMPLDILESAANLWLNARH